MEPIKKFADKYDFLSNDFDCEITYEGITYSSATTAWIASKCEDNKAKRKFSRLSAGSARKKRNLISANPEWEEKKDDILYSILKEKFSNDSLKKELLDTGDAELINTVTYPDEEYGIYYNKGRNKLGKMLMRLRKELQ